jgi:hypothetical protein
LRAGGAGNAQRYCDGDDGQKNSSHGLTLQFRQPFYHWDGCD